MSDASARLIGIDLGTTACKAALYDLEGRTLERVVTPYPIDRPAPGRAEQDAASWERAVLDALERLEARVRPASVAAIGLTSQVNTHLFVDAAGEPLAPALVWQDVRAADDAAALDATLSTEERLAWWGAPMPIDASHALARMAWTARVRPELWARTARVLLPKDHLLARLTGECASDPLSNVGLVGADGAHVPALLDRVPGAARRLPPLGAPDAIVGRVRPGLPFAGRPVALGTMDAWAGLAGLGAVGDGDGLYLGGTSEILGIVSRDAVPTPGVLVMPESLGVRLHVGPTQSGGASLGWAARLLDTDAAGALELAAAHDPAHRYPLFLPHLDGERAPLWDASARGLFLGVEARTDRCALARAVLDGVACSARWLLDALEASADRRPRALRAGGGGFRDDAWNRLRADALDRALELVDAPDPGALGAAAIAAVAVGLHAELRAACDALVSVRATVEPDPAGVARQAERVWLYRDAYAATRELSARFVRLGG